MHACTLSPLPLPPHPHRTRMDLGAEPAACEEARRCLLPHIARNRDLRMVYYTRSLLHDGFTAAHIPRTNILGG